MTTAPTTQAAGDDRHGLGPEAAHTILDPENHIYRAEIFGSPVTLVAIRNDAWDRIPPDSRPASIPEASGRSVLALVWPPATSPP